jgi:hypothetical protein
MIRRLVARWLRLVADKIDPPNGGPATFVAYDFFVPPGVEKVTWEVIASGGGGKDDDQ